MRRRGGGRRGEKGAGRGVFYCVVAISVCVRIMCLTDLEKA